MNSAMDGGRSLHIRSRRQGQEDIRVDVCDAGVGFKDMEEAFEPFFTTKEDGMGMGLAICRSIIESHGGRLWIANGTSRGVIVSITLRVEHYEAP